MINATPSMTEKQRLLLILDFLENHTISSRGGMVRNEGFRFDALRELRSFVESSVP